MALVIVTTPGDATANSYASLADAEAYVLTLPLVAADWAGCPDPKKNAALVQATRMMDTLTWKGVLTAPGVQTLLWPRSGVVLPDSQNMPNVFGVNWALTVPSTTIPAKVRDACCEFAIRLVSDDWTQGLGPVTNETLKVGSIDLGRETYRPFPAAVVAMLKPYLTVSPNSGGRMVRG